MTLNELYMKTKLWMYEKPSSVIYDNYIVEITNKVLAEIFEEHNMMRMFKGEPPFKNMFQIPLNADRETFELKYPNGEEDDVSFEDEYLYDVIPKGIDANFLMDDDLSKMSIYQTEYNNARVYRQCLVPACKIEELTKEAI